MVNYTDHSKFIYADYDAIQDAIHSGDINVNDIIYTKDTHENVIVGSDYDIYPVQCRVYRFNDIFSANSILNERTDTYTGQIVAILGDNGSYSAYIVNKRITGKFAVDPLNTNDPNSTIDYNTLGNRPIINLEGETFSPVILDKQNDGIYKVSGSYKLSDTVDATFYGGNSYIFMIKTEDDGSKLIKRIGAGEITDYILTGDGVTTSIVPTTEWLKEQGYVTESYVTNLINTMDLITKDEIEQYVSNVINSEVTVLVQNIVTQELNDRLQAITEREAFDVFTNVFN